MGFSVPKTFYDSITDGEYEVIIETEEGEGILKIVEHIHRGDLDESIAIYANLDHPGVANDGLAGVAVGIEVFREKWLARKTKFTYRLVLAQGMIGSEYYLGKANIEERIRFSNVYCLWMLGSNTGLALQESRSAYFQH